MDICDFVRQCGFMCSDLTDDQIFNDIKRLDFDNKQLTSIPDSIGDLINLEVLNLSFNQLISIPDSISCLTKLTDLYLHSNQLTSIPDSVNCLTKLKWLNLSDNQLTHLPDSLSDLANLNVLYLSNNKLTSQAEEVLRVLVMTNSMIQILQTDEFNFTDELNRNWRREPAPGRTTVKSAIE